MQCRTEDGSIDYRKCLQHRQKTEETSFLERNKLLSLIQEAESSQVSTVEGPKRKRVRRFQSLRPYFFDDEGNCVCLQPKQTFWHFMHVKGQPQNKEMPAKIQNAMQRVPEASSLSVNS